MELGKTNYALQVTWLTTYARWVVVHIDVQARRPENRFKAADAKDKQENYSRLEAILQSIFMFNKN